MIQSAERIIEIIEEQRTLHEKLVDDCARYVNNETSTYLKEAFHKSWLEQKAMVEVCDEILNRIQLESE